MCCRTAVGGQAIGHLGNRGPLTGHRQNGRAASASPCGRAGLLGRLLAVGDKAGTAWRLGAPGSAGGSPAPLEKDV